MGDDETAEESVVYEVSEAVVKRILEVFAKWDIMEDGLIPIETLPNIECGPRKFDVTSMLREMDTNDDGRVEKSVCAPMVQERRMRSQHTRGGRRSRTASLATPAGCRDGLRVQEWETYWKQIVAKTGEATFTTAMNEIDNADLLDKVRVLLLNKQFNADISMPDEEEGEEEEGEAAELSEERAKKVDELFSAWDPNGTGKIMLTRMRAAGIKVGPTVFDPTEAFAQMDTNADGSVSKEELVPGALSPALSPAHPTPAHPSPAHPKPWPRPMRTPSGSLRRGRLRRGRCVRRTRTPHIAFVRVHIALRVRAGRPIATRTH